MAIALAKVNVDSRNHSVGNRRESVVDLTLDNSYPTGGYALTPLTLGADLALDYIIAQPTTTGHVFAYDYANKKLMVFSGGSQVANATDLSAVVARLIVQGKGPGV